MVAPLPELARNSEAAGAETRADQSYQRSIVPVRRIFFCRSSTP